MRDKKTEAPVLLAQSGPLRGMNWMVNRNLKIGRDADCDIVINDRQVSRFHAEIKNESQNDFYLVDHQSKNGTFLNGVQVSEEVPLKDGDEVKIALAQEFIFVSSDATLPIEHLASPNVPAGKKLFIEQKARRVWLGDQELLPPLSVSQFILLVLLYENEGKVITRQEIVNSVWGEEGSGGVTEQAIDALIRRLRERLHKLDSLHEYITTVRGAGFIFENDRLS